MASVFDRIAGWFRRDEVREAEARDGEKKEMPQEMQDQMADMDKAMTDISYHDLHHPWFATAGKR